MEQVAVLSTTPRARQAVLGSRELVPGELWSRLVNRIQKDHPGIGKQEAEGIMDSALGFLKMCADFPEHHFAPSEKVDVGWHTFLMYTKEYHEFCGKAGGRFIHHVPNDDPSATQIRGGLGATVRFMKKHKIPFNRNLWVGTADCTVDCRDDCWSCSTNSCTS